MYFYSRTGTFGTVFGRERGEYPVLMYEIPMILDPRFAERRKFKVLEQEAAKEETPKNTAKDKMKRYLQSFWAFIKHGPVEKKEKLVFG